MNDSLLAEKEEVEFLDDDRDAIQTLLATSTQATTKTSNINYNDENIENYDPSTHAKSKRSSSRQKVNDIKDSTRIIAEVAENTYLLNKEFYKEVVGQKTRMAETQERVATIAEKCAAENCKIM